MVVANLCEDHQRVPLLGRADPEKGLEDDESPEFLPRPNVDAKMNWDPLLLYRNPNM